MSTALVIIAIAYLPAVIGISASLRRLADAVVQQNRHYGISTEPAPAGTETNSQNDS